MKWILTSNQITIDEAIDCLVSKKRFNILFIIQKDLPKTSL